MGEHKDEGELCYHYRGEHQDHFTINCDKPITGQYVTIAQSSRGDNPILRLCEVQVFVEGMR